jgi:flagellar motor switch protein FliN/FliY
LGREITTESSKEVPLPDLANWNLTHLRFRDSEAFPIFLGFNPAAASALEALQADLSPASGAPPGSGSVDGAIPSGASLQPESKTLDLLMDVEMPVSVSFGRAELPLKEVLKLATGSIVELNRSISEPVEVVVNNCVIARGEVVVIEGNYGIRINQIISRQDRLRTLK